MSNTKQETLVKIEQSLHGYADGHRLLEASRKLSSEAERLMLHMSDMSGPSMIPGFETYITGYALTDLGTYALGRTWYAPEMKRPGCVWTHTLLIENSDLAHIKDLRVLLTLFRRPSVEASSWKDYKSTLHLSIGNDSYNAHLKTVALDGMPYPSVASNVLEALYGRYDKAVYIPTSLPSQYEDLVFPIWNQQWPRLRRTFTFSLGSIANRKTSGKPFDLQIISLKSLSQLSRESPSSVVVNLQDSQNVPNCPVWVLTATADLLSNSEGHLRRFLQRHGADATSGRSSFSRLVEVYTFIENFNNHTASLKDLVQLLGQTFPTPQEASRLKLSLLGSNEVKKSSLLHDVPEARLLWELATTPYYEAFELDQMNVRNRARMLLESHREEARKITLNLFESKLTPLGEEFLTGISEAISIDDAYEFARFKPELLNAFTKHNPALAAMPGLWRSSADEQRDFFDIVIADPRTESRSISNMVIAMLEAGSDVLAEEVLSRYPEAAKTILEWTDSNLDKSRALSVEWQRSLRSTPSQLLNWLENANEPRPSTVAFIITLLDPHSPKVINFGANIWLPFIQQARKSLPYNTYIHSMAYLLALGFNNPPSGAVALVSGSFEVVHDAAANSELPQSSWRQLKDQAPAYSSWWSWDKCRRLRCALIDKFIRYDWPVECFLESVRGRKIFRKVLENCDDITNGKKFRRYIAEQVIRGGIKAAPYQIQELTYYHY